MDAVLAEATLSWGIVGASLRRSATRDALAPQDFLYTLGRARWLGRVKPRHRVHAPDTGRATQRRELLAAMVDPRIRIVSLTVTEKGYCHDPATGELDPRHPYMLHDLAHPEAPVTVPGLLVRALELRRAAGIAPFTVLCCDNLPENGRTTARIVTGFALLRDEGLAELHRCRSRFPFDHGRPDRSGDHRSGSKARSWMPRAWRCVAGCNRALQPMGDRGSLSRRQACARRRPGRSSWRTCARLSS